MRTSARRPRVLLIAMPFGSLDRPALGISLLKSSLTQRGFACDVAYFNLLLGEMTGLDAYSRFSQSGGAAEAMPQTALVGEWAFSQDFHGPGSLDGAAYTNLLRKSFGLSEERVRDALEMRRVVPAFLDRCMAGVDLSLYDLVGFSTTFEQNMASLCLARRMKQAKPGLLIAFGGGNCEGAMGLELHRQYPFIDFVATGEADESFPALVEALSDGRDPSGIGGLVWRRRGRSASNGAPRLIKELDALPYPDFDDYFARLRASPLSGRFGLWLPLESARGCWWGERSHCTFCGLNGLFMAFRSKSPARVLRELDQLSRRHACRHVAFVDNIVDMGYFRSVLPELARRGGKGPKLFYETKSNLRREQVRLLGDAGVTHIQPGIESFDSGVLALMGKGVRASQNIQLLKWCAVHGVEPEYNILYGFPGEDPAACARMRETMESLTHLRPPVSTSPIRLDRFSPNFDQAARKGLIRVRPLAAYRHVYPFDEATLSRLSYFFDFDYADGRRPREYARAMVEFCARWRKSYKPGSLRYRPRADGGAVIEDARFNRVAAGKSFDAPRARLIELCDEARRPEALAADAVRLGIRDPGRVRALLDDLVRWKWMVRDGDAYVSVVPTPDAKEASWQSEKAAAAA